MTEILVATTEKRKKSMKRRPGSRVRFFADGTWHDITYLNVELPIVAPDADMTKCRCERCEYGYSHMLTSISRTCNECRTESTMQAAERLESQGVPMGAGMVEVFRRRSEEAGSGWDFVGTTQMDRVSDRKQYLAAAKRLGGGFTMENANESSSGRGGGDPR